MYQNSRCAAAREMFSVLLACQIKSSVSYCTLVITFPPPILLSLGQQSGSQTNNCNLIRSTFLHSAGAARPTDDRQRDNRPAPCFDITKYTKCDYILRPLCFTYVTGERVETEVERTLGQRTHFVMNLTCVL